MLIVVAGDGPSFFGRNWQKHLELDWRKITSVCAHLDPLQILLQENEALFKDKLGTVKPFCATLSVNSNASPKFFKPRPVPFAVKDAIGQELD